MPKPEPDPYAVLGVARNASPEEIRAAYRELVAKYHPDRHQGNPLEELAAAKLAEINRAHEILSDAERRAAYDRGQPVWPRPVASPFTTTPTGRKRNRFMLVVGILLLLPLLFRFGRLLVRLLVRAFEGLAALRGTPALLAATVIGVVVVVLLYLRRRRRKPQ